MNCAEARRLLGPLVDRELEPALAAEVEGHLLSCPACSGELDALRALRNAVGSVARHTASDALVQRVTDSLPRRKTIRFDLALAFAAGAAAMLLLSLVLRPVSPGRALADQLVAAHVRALATGPLVEVVSSDRHTVKPWFNGRVDTAPTPVELSREGYPLLGGRVDRVRGKPIAVLVYGRRRHRIDVFELVATADSGFWEADRAGHHIVGWTTRGLESVAVSDIDPADLRRFAGLVRAGGG